IDSRNRLPQRRNMGPAERENQNRKSNSKSRNWAGNAYVKKNSPRAQRRSNANECTECANQARKRNEERERGVHAILHAVKIVPQFVREQDAHQRERKGQAQK